MSTEPPAEPAAPAPAKKFFRNKFNAVRLAPDAVERQSRVTMFAFRRLGSAPAIAFLNAYHDELAGRPLDLAVASATGCEAVERAIEAHAAQGQALA